MSRFKLFLPLIIFVILSVFFWAVLNDESYDPQSLPSALIDKPVPEFSLTSLSTGEPLRRSDILGEKMLLNVWATWCISCRVEHPFLNQLTSEGIKVLGINYKDSRSAAMKWLQDLGNPYQLNIFDDEGVLGLDLGVYGAPETYIIDAKGIVRYKYVGVVNRAVWQDKLKPVYEGLD